MATPFKSLSFTAGSVFTTAKAQQMADNDQYLFENMPRVYFRTGVKRSTGLKQLATSVKVPKTSATRASASIWFSGFFSYGCKPIVVMSVSPGWNFGDAERIGLTFHGIGAGTVDHRGVTGVVHSNGKKKLSLPVNMTVHALITGY